VTPFALRSAAQFRPDGPTAHVDERGRPNRAYVRQARQVLRDSRQLDDRTKSIAAYWWDGPSTELPPGHWCLLAQYVSRRDHHSVDQDAQAVLALTGALLDASIAARDAKRAYDSVRPITAIRPHDHQRDACRLGGQMVDELQEPLVGPVDVLEHNYQRQGGRHPLEEAAPGGEVAAP
jgi:hypothetical protein